MDMQTSLQHDELFGDSATRAILAEGEIGCMQAMQPLQTVWSPSENLEEDITVADVAMDCMDPPTFETLLDHAGFFVQPACLEIGEGTDTELAVDENPERIIAAITEAVLTAFGNAGEVEMRLN